MGLGPSVSGEASVEKSERKGAAPADHAAVLTAARAALAAKPDGPAAHRSRRPLPRRTQAARVQRERGVRRSGKSHRSRNGGVASGRSASNLDFPSLPETLMRRFLPPALLLFLAASAFADPDPVRAMSDDYVKELIDAQDWKLKLKLAGQLRGAEGAPAALVAACLARTDLKDKGWNLTTGVGEAVEGRNAETVAAVRALLKDKDDAHAMFGLQLIERCDLAAACASELIALWVREADDVGARALGAFSNCRDEKAMAMIVAESRKKGEPGKRGFRAVCSAIGAGARARVREIVLDPQEPMERRTMGMYALNRMPGTEEIEVARAVLATGEPELLEPALLTLEELHADVDGAILRPHVNSTNEKVKRRALRLLSRSGDEAAAKYCLERAGESGAWDRGEWYVWAGMSGLASIRAELEKALGEETEDSLRMQVLRGIGETGDAGSIDLIMKYVSHPEQGYNAMYALAAAGRKNPKALDASLDRLAAVQGTTSSGLDSFPSAFLEHPTPGQRVQLIDAYVRLVERVKDRPLTRQVVSNALTSMCEPAFGDAGDVAERWTEWWAANREAFLKKPPKGR